MYKKFVSHLVSSAALHLPPQGLHAAGMRLMASYAAAAAAAAAAVELHPLRLCVSLFKCVRAQSYSCVCECVCVCVCTKARYRL
jgi:hypothetical protein